MNIVCVDSIPILFLCFLHVGVCQLVNKMAFTETEVFSRADEHLLEDFAVYCALGLQKFNAQQRTDKTRAQLAVTKEVGNAITFLLSHWKSLHIVRIVNK